MLAEITFTFSILFGILQAFAKHFRFDSQLPLVDGSSLFRYNPSQYSAILTPYTTVQRQVLGIAVR